MVTGTSGSHQRVKPEYLDNTDVVLPPKHLIHEVTLIVKPMFERYALNLEENVALAALRDTLLPKLLSGEIRLNEVEKAVEAAV